MSDEMVIFTRVFDLLAWLVPKSETFPRSHRLSVTPRLLNTALDVQDRLSDAQARRGAPRLDALREADAALARLRIYLRLAHRLRWLSDRQYEHVSLRVAEVGRLLGGWIKQSGGH